MHPNYHPFSLYLLLFCNNVRQIIGLSGGNFMPTFNLNYLVLFSAQLFDFEFCFGLAIRIRRRLLISNVKGNANF
jgi:hypothetical protein